MGAALKESKRFGRSLRKIQSTYFNENERFGHMLVKISNKIWIYFDKDRI